MGGHEFRQAQTAIIAYYIDKQDNFGLYYETPLLGKPWAFPFEVPFYQWAVVGLKRATGLEDFETARIISLSSFYLTLPALYLLLGSWRIPPARRLIVLLPALLCPVYLFYSRAFLIDPMATCFSVWFLAAFVRTMDKRHWAWLILTILCGSIGILIKSVVFAVWLFPAALYGLWCLWRAWGEEHRWRQLAITCAWGVGSVALPYWLFREWIIFSDALKWAHPSGFQFTSEVLSTTNFGTFEIGSRFSTHTWSSMAERWAEAVAPWWLLAGVVLLGLVVGGRWRGMFLGLVGLWFFGQLAFPYAYAYQDYYFYGATFWLMLALGVLLLALAEHHTWPRWLRAGLALAPLAVMLVTYLQDYRQTQLIPSEGGSGLTAMLNDVLPRESVLMIIGQDWAGIVPYYSERRALMVRDALRFDIDYLNHAMNDLEDEDVGALLVSGDMREQTAIIDMVINRLGMFSEPLVDHRNYTDVYFSVLHQQQVSERFTLGGARYPEITLNPQSTAYAEAKNLHFRISPHAATKMFPLTGGLVKRFQILMGYREYRSETDWVINFHPDAAVWIEPEHRTGVLTMEFGIFADAWKREGDKTNGVVFSVFAEDAQGERRLLYERLVDPVTNETDRGRQREQVPYALAADEFLLISSGPHHADAYDWAYLGQLNLDPRPSGL